MMDDVTGLLKRICSDRKLERDASLEILQKGIDQLTNEKLQSVHILLFFSWY